MKKFKKFLAIILAILLISATLPIGIFTVSAASVVDGGKCGDNANWILYGNGELAISGYGEMTSAPWRDNYTKSIKTVNIYNGITSIVWDAFDSCTELTSITIPNSVSSIGGFAFYGCKGLTIIEIPNNVASIEDGVFNYCTGLTSIEIPTGVSSIGDSAFAGCTGLTNISIPNSVTSIGSKAFYGCSKLENILIGNEITSIGENAFDGTAYSKDVNNWSDPQAFNTMPYGLLYIGNYLVDANISTPLPTNVYTIKKGTRVIAGRTFDSCTYLKGITIPDSIISIGDFAFSGCTGLTSINIPNSVTSIGDSAFYGCTGLININIPDGVTDIEHAAFSGCTGLTSINIPNSVTSIGSAAFDSCTGLTSIEIPNSVIGIGSDAFYGCTGLTSIIIPNSVTRISNYAFQGCTGLTRINIPNSVTSIGSWAFSYCIGFTSIEIPNSVTSIENEAFYGCTGLTNVEIPDSVMYLGEGAFSGCATLKVITVDINNSKYHSKNNCIIESDTNKLILGCETSIIPEYVTSIADSAFAGCTGLTNINITNSVTSIGSSAFEDCTGLTSVEIPDSVIYLGAGAFYNTAWYNNQPDGLIYAGKVAYVYKGTMPENTSITLKVGIKSIASSAFAGCTGLTNISIPNSVTSIESEAFYGCAGLTSINIPNSVTSIESAAFYGCTGLTSINIPNSVTSIESAAFYGCTGLTNINIPNSVTRIGDSAFSNCNNLQYSEYDNALYLGNSVNKYLYLAKSKSENITDCIINEKTKFIGSHAFLGCNKLTNIAIPNTVTCIGDSAFAFCTELKNISMSDNLIYVCVNSFMFTEWFSNQPVGIVYVGKVAFAYIDEYLDAVVIKEGTLAISDGAFAGCDGIKTVSIPSSVTSIGYYAFEDCDALEKIYGYAGTEAERVAEEYGVEFVALDEENETKYTVKFIDNGQTVSEREITENSVLGELPTATKPGENYEFLGWFDENDNEYTANSVITEDVTLYPKWKKSEITISDISFEFTQKVYTDVNLYQIPSVFKVKYEGEDNYTQVTTGYTLSKKSFDKAGNQKITVNYGEISKEFTVSVTKSILTDMYLVGVPENAVYTVGQTPDFSNIRLHLTYNSGTEKTATPTSFDYDFSSPGKKTVDVTYIDNGIEYGDSFDVTVIGKPTVLIDNITANAGDEITVSVKISGNSGLMGYAFKISYDDSILTPVSSEAGENFADGYFVDDIETEKSGELSVHWCGSDNVTNDGILFNLTFKVSDSAKSQDTAVSVEPIAEEIYNADWQDISVTGNECSVTINNHYSVITLIENAGLTIKNGILYGIKATANFFNDVISLFKNDGLIFTDRDGNVLSQDSRIGTGSKITLKENGTVKDEVVVVIKGDMNGDGKANNKDVSMMMRYLVEKENPDNYQLEAADVNGDGEINNIDAAKLARYFVGKEVI